MLNAKPGADRAQWFPYVTVDRTSGRVWVHDVSKPAATHAPSTKIGEPAACLRASHPRHTIHRDGLEGIRHSEIEIFGHSKMAVSPRTMAGQGSLARTLELEQTRAGRKLDMVGGYFTCVRAVRFKTPQEMEEILGFAPGSFRSGVSVWKLRTLPTPDQFDLRGYTQLPGGESFDGIVLRRNDVPRPQFFTQTGAPAAYIPGLAVEQWELRRGFLVPADELERVDFGRKFTRWR